MIHFFNDLTAEQYAQAGGKGAMLARLFQEGYPVPNGFVILPTAFEKSEIEDQIEGEINVAVWQEARRMLKFLREEGSSSKSGVVSFAVRSSALSEDGAHASFAGEFESVLDVESDEAVWQAIQRVRASRKTARVQAYSAAKGMTSDHEMAVVVQCLVRAEMAGVLFTANPVTGSRVEMVGNFVHGLGEQLVSGEANALHFTLKHPKGKYEGPKELASLAKQLYKFANRLEKELEAPQDIEWAIAAGKLYLLQARPITTMQAHNIATGEWNDSLLGDYLWTNANFGEALPDVMTPFTWSIMQAYFRNNAIGIESPHFPMGGNIGGRLYMNVSFFVSITDTIRLSRKKMLRMLGEVFGNIPPEIEIPTLPLSAWWLLRTLPRHLFRRMRLVGGLKKRIPSFVANAPALAEQLNRQIRAAHTPNELLALWHSELKALLDETCLMLAAGTSDYKNLSRTLHMDLEKMVGDADANALLSGMSNQHEHLASLGPLIGLTEVAKGEMTREAYLQQYGHRGTNELELSQPRSAEVPNWLEQQLAEVKRNPINPRELLANQQAEHQAAWQRFTQAYPRKTKTYRKKLDKMAEAARSREATRSEVVRMFGVLRTFALQVGQLEQLSTLFANQDDIFFLSLEEIIQLLNGNESAVAYIPARQATHARYKALPPYPALINGRFDPFQWAADPKRRYDIFDAHATTQHATNLSDDRFITGFAGAAGVVEGVIRVLNSPEEGHHLQTGEILVATTTNIGWTPLFPRLAAIITDVGAPLSHAAIVARELGIPAVVGCGNATMRLKTGDKVRVNGGQGTVEVLV